MRILLRSALTALLCAAAIFAGDALFRASLLDSLRPIVLTPRARAVVRPPVRLTWEGRTEMEILLAPFGETASSLGVHASPFDIEPEHFPREGGYEVEIRAPGWAGWIAATRKFQMHRTSPTTDPDLAADLGPADDSRYLMLAFDAARKARDKARARVKSLRKENATLKGESERLAVQLDEVFVGQEEEFTELAALEADLLDAVNEIRGLREENLALRFRLGSVIPCTVWGYLSYPRPQTIPPSRRVVRVSDTAGNIFRTEEFCAAARRSDSTADSRCLCVGDSFGGQ